ncbi:Secreted lipase [Fusarium oxysporum f. sp. cubense]|uniref:Secreted lipase n=1 Tax=Fusarium oxysporum f. sp. cubense TaxID=61366 RepID=A0A559LUK5_FUSOC|nr:Secreted lipase [Fusarium oxysporum f. sp. cubense]
MILSTLVLCCFLVFVEARSLPFLKLPYGTWQASSFDEVAKVYTFKNIRYGAPPIGNRRFAKPEPPEAVSGIQDGSKGAACMQLHTSGTDINTRDEPVIPDYSKIIQASLSKKVYSEDCLFLDLYMPEESLKSDNKLPVMVFVHGGGYTTGSKDMLDVVGLYDGTGLVKQSKGRVIVVTLNYRLGVFGWLGGTTAELAGATNLGLMDQRLAFEWVQKYIHLVGGDRNNVTAFGESAGGGSLMHHLTLGGGTIPPLFNRVQIYSAGLAYNFDRKGKLEDAFQKFSAVAGCQGKGFSCLRAASPQRLILGQIAVAGLSFTIAKPQFGPVPDGNLVKNAASLDLAAGRYWKQLDSVLVAHAIDDAGLFVDPTIKTDAAFLKLLLDAFGYVDIVASLAAEYPAEDYSSPLARQQDVLKDAVFACNYRWVTNAFPRNSYNMQFSGGSSGSHGQVLPGVFYNPTLTVKANGTNFPVADYFGNQDIFNSLQSYIVSHAISGSPNTYRNAPSTISWPKVSGATSENLGNVLNVTNNGFHLITDRQGTSSRCDFWLAIHSELANKANL